MAANQQAFFQAATEIELPPPQLWTLDFGPWTLDFGLRGPVLIWLSAKTNAKPLEPSNHAPSSNSNLRFAPRAQRSVTQAFFHSSRAWPARTMARASVPMARAENRSSS